MPGLGRSTGRTMAAVLFAALATFCTTPAQAGKVVIITQPPGGGIIPKGDPVYDFTVNAYLGSGYDLWTGAGDGFTLLAIPGVSVSSPSFVVPGPSLPLFDGWLAQPGQSPGTTDWPGAGGEKVSIDNFGWTLVESITGLGGPIENCPTTEQPNDPLYLGSFTVDTYRNLSELPEHFSITLTYLVQAHDCDGNLVHDTGTVTLTLGPPVPEPASIALLGLGAALPAVAAARRRRAAG